MLSTLPSAWHILGAQKTLLVITGYKENLLYSGATPPHSLLSWPHPQGTQYLPLQHPTSLGPNHSQTALIPKRLNLSHRDDGLSSTGLFPTPPATPNLDVTQLCEWDGLEGATGRNNRILPCRTRVPAGRGLGLFSLKASQICQEAKSFRLQDPEEPGYNKDPCSNC